MPEPKPLPPILRSHKEIKEQTTVYILPHEALIIQALLKDLQSKHTEMSSLLAEAMDQSSETWHDNAPADVARDEGNIIAWKAQQLAGIAINSEVIDYPELNDSAIRIGSQALISINGSAAFMVDIVGAHPLNRQPYISPNGYDVEIATYKSPLATALLGRAQDDTFEASLGDNITEFTILSIDQKAQLNNFEAYCQSIVPDTGAEASTIT